MIPTLERIARDLWASHYRIPELAFWGSALASVVALIAVPPGEQTTAFAFALGLSLVGIARWRLAKRRCRFGTIVPLFEEGGGAQGRGAEAQTMIVDHLRRHIPEPLKSLIQPLPVRIGPADEAFANRLRKRLRALYVLHGRVTARGDSWSIYPRVLEGPNENVTHYDKFTRDITPARPSFGPFVSKLPPSIGVRDEEFPLEFCQDLEAVIQGLAGMAFAAFNDHGAAIEALDRSLAKAQQSTNHQIDVLRVRRALSLAAIGRLDSAISSLRDRLELPDPSPHLLRGLAYLLSDRAWNNKSTEPDADLDEARGHLQTALESTTDPEMDTTAYNLVMLLPFDDPEKKRLVTRLLGKASSYRNLWYVRKLPADIAWSAYTEALENGDERAARHFAKESARWYSRMLRARPRIQFRGVKRQRPFLAIKTYPRSPILYGNTKDGHTAAGHRVRAKYFESLSKDQKSNAEAGRPTSS